MLQRFFYSTGKRCRSVNAAYVQRKRPGCMREREHLPDSCRRILSWCDRRPRWAEHIARQRLEHTSDDSYEYPWLQLTLGWCLMIREHPDAAIPLLQQAQDSFRQHGKSWGALHAEHGILRVKLLQGIQVGNITAWDDLAQRCIQDGFLLESAQVRIEQMRVLNMLWRSSEVLALRDETQSLLAPYDEPHSQARLVRILGVARLQIGDFLQAAQDLTQADEQFHKLRLPIEHALTLFEQARLALLQDTFHESRRLHQQAHQLFIHWDLPLRSAFCLKNLGIIAASLGETHQAINQILTAKHMFEDLSQEHHVADCILNLGIAAFYNGLYELALGSWKQVERAYMALDLQGMLLISRRNQALALFQMQQFDRAQKLVSDLLHDAEQSGAQRELAELYQLMGEIWYTQGEKAQALICLERAETSFLRLPNRAAAARVWLAQGWMALNDGALLKAKTLFLQAQPELSQRQQYSWRVWHGLGRCAEACENSDEALACYTKASAILAQQRHSLTNTYASSALFSTAQQLYHDALLLAIQQQQAETLLLFIEQQRAMALQQYLHREPFIFHPRLKQDYEQKRAALQRLLAHNTPSIDLDAAIAAYLETLFYGRHYGARDDEYRPLYEDIDIVRLRNVLSTYYSDDWTVIVYSSFAKDLVAVMMTPHQLTIHPIPMDRALQRSFQRITRPQYRPYIYQDIPFQSGQQCVPWQDFSLLGQQLLPPDVNARLHPDHRLLIVPCATLHNVPWAALRVQEHWLVEQATIQLLPSLRIWEDLLKCPCTGNQALLLGVSDYGDRASALPNAITSLDRVQQYWHGPCIRLENTQVNRSALLDAARTGDLQRYRLIHLSLHGHQLAGHGMLAHLKLSDDDLLVDEVAQLHLGGALVVLAACEGASEEYLPGEEVLSLNRAFLFAGAQDVIASWWSLYDSTILLMLDVLYAALFRAKDAPTALAIAQRHCLNHDQTSDLALPLTWASLCALGAGVASLSSAVVPLPPTRV